MIKIIIDVNLPPSLVSILENEGWEALHWSSIGDPGATDSERLCDTQRRAVM